MFVPLNPDEVAARHHKPASIIIVSNPSQGFYVGVPYQFKRYEDVRGCVMIRVPEYAEGLYCDQP